LALHRSHSASSKISLFFGAEGTCLTSTPTILYTPFTLASSDSGAGVSPKVTLAVHYLQTFPPKGALGLDDTDSYMANLMEKQLSPPVPESLPERKSSARAPHRSRPRVTTSSEYEAGRKASIAASGIAPFAGSSPKIDYEAESARKKMSGASEQGTYADSAYGSIASHRSDFVASISSWTANSSFGGGGRRSSIDKSRKPSDTKTESRNTSVASYASHNSSTTLHHSRSNPQDHSRTLSIASSARGFDADARDWNSSGSPSTANPSYGYSVAIFHEPQKPAPRPRARQTNTAPVKVPLLQNPTPEQVFGLDAYVPSSPLSTSATVFPGQRVAGSEGPLATTPAAGAASSAPKMSAFERRMAKRDHMTQAVFVGDSAPPSPGSVATTSSADTTTPGVAR